MVVFNDAKEEMKDTASTPTTTQGVALTKSASALSPTVGKPTKKKDDDDESSVPTMDSKSKPATPQQQQNKKTSIRW